eukprot:3080136-Amphidinium_carterae.1
MLAITRPLATLVWEEREFIRQFAALAEHPVQHVGLTGAWYGQSLDPFIAGCDVQTHPEDLQHPSAIRLVWDTGKCSRSFCSTRSTIKCEANAHDASISQNMWNEARTTML